MAKNIKITKQELKKNDMLDLYGRTKDYIAVHSDKIKPVLIGAFVVIAAVIIIFVSIRKKMDDANERYTEVLYKYTNSIFSGSYSYDHILGELQGAYNTFTKSNLSKIMILNIADVYYRNKDYQNALINYDKFLKLNSDPTFSAVANYGKALVYIQQKNYGDALNQLKDLAASKNAEFIKPEVLIQTAITYSRLKDDANAVNALSEITGNEQFKDSSWNLYANYLRVLLTQKKNLPDINYVLIEETDTPAISVTNDTANSN